MAKADILGKLYAVNLRKDETDLDIVISRIEPVFKSTAKLDANGEPTGDREFIRDEQGNPVEDPRRRRIFFKVEGDDVPRSQFVFTNTFTDGKVPTITDYKKGLNARMTVWTDDEDHIQVSMVAYNPGDAVVVATSTLEALNSGKVNFALK